MTKINKNLLGNVSPSETLVLTGGLVLIWCERKTPLTPGSAKYW
jgi:hypothetical protein